MIFTLILIPSNSITHLRSLAWLLLAFPNDHHVLPVTTTIGAYFIVTYQAVGVYWVRSRRSILLRLTPDKAILLIIHLWIHLYAHSSLTSKNIMQPSLLGLHGTMQASACTLPSTYLGTGAEWPFIFQLLAYIPDSMEAQTCIS